MVVPLLLCLLAIAIPSKDTMYKMLIASHTTPENIEKIIKLADSLKDEIKDDIKEIIKETKGK